MSRSRETNFLYIEKRQRIDIAEEYSRRATRIAEELQKQGWNYRVAYMDQISIEFRGAEMIVHVGDTDIREFTHISFGGHANPTQYELRYLINEYLMKHNEEHPEAKVLVQNSYFTRLVPYYDKLQVSKMCIDAGLPYFHSYYHTGGDYETLPIPYPVIAKHQQGENDLVSINGENKIKKNIFKLESKSDWDQERLSTKQRADFLIQEFSDKAQDLRIFIAKGETVGGFIREATEGFMTVNKGKYTLLSPNDIRQEVLELCNKAYEAWRPDFFALDIMYMDDKPYIQEFAMQPGFYAYETKATGGTPANIAKVIIESFSE